MLVRHAISQDVDAIYNLIHELAVFERAGHEFINSKENLLKDGFSDKPTYICFVAEENGVVIGMSLCYTRYSTWKGNVLYLEDLIVTEALRGKGFGKALFEYTIQYAKQNNYARLSWQVLDWNVDAINFYKLFDAEIETGWLNAWINMK